MEKIEKIVRQKLSSYRKDYRDKLDFNLKLLGSFIEKPITYDHVFDRFEDLDRILGKLVEIAVPIEEDQFLKELEPIEDAKSMLSRAYVAGLDTSYRRNPEKFIYPFLYVSTAYFVTGPALEKPLTGIKSAFYFLDEVYDPSLTDIQIRLRMERYIKENEAKVVRLIVSQVKETPEKKIIIFDEAFSPFFLSGAHRDLLKLHNQVLNEKFQTLISNGFTPVAVYETLNHSFSKFLILNYYCKPKGKKCESCTGTYCEKYSVPDKFLIEVFILKSGKKEFCRTCLLHFLSNLRRDYVSSEDMEIIGFYLSLRKGEIVRVEFPRAILKRRDAVEFIHKIIVTSSIQGAGYPYVLNKTHEMARKRADEMKRRIELLISDVAERIYPYGVFTAKQLAKRRRGV